MHEPRTALHLIIRSHPRGVNPLCLLVRTGGAVRQFHPHIGLAWERLARPRAGGPALVRLGSERRPGSGRSPRAAGR